MTSTVHPARCKPRAVNAPLTKPSSSKSTLTRPCPRPRDHPGSPLTPEKTRMRIYLRRRFFAAMSLTTLVIVACVISSTNRPHPLEVSGAEHLVKSPIKAHLADGSTVLFRRGAMVGNQQIVGDGVRFSATLDSSRVDHIALDNVIGVESFERDVNPGRTLIYAPISGFVSTVVV